MFVIDLLTLLMETGLKFKDLNDNNRREKVKIKELLLLGGFWGV